MTLIAVVVFLILFISFVCSILEAVLLSVTDVYVAMAVNHKKKYGIILQHLKKNIDRPISAVLTLNTISHTAGSAIIGAMIHEQYGSQFVTSASVFLTLAILLFSEIIPKTIGAAQWKHIAPFSAYILQVLVFSLYPLIYLTEFISRIFKHPTGHHRMTREEMIMNAELGVTEGTLKAKESHIIKNLLMLDSIFVADIMTPRSVFTAFDSESTVEEIAKEHNPIRFSRVPVYKENLDNIIGLTHRYKILEALSNDKHNLKVQELMAPIQTVSEKMTVASAIDFFIKHKEHLAIATDEYGVITGLVTLEDAVETLLGVEIVDEFDKVPDMRQYALEQWQMRKSQFRKS